MKGLVRHQAWIVVAAAIVFFTNLGVPKLWDRDEPRNAGCAAEMLRRGDWVVPVFNAELRPHKPVLLYWLMMTAYGLFGVNEFGARFFSAVLGVGTALATYHIGRRLFNARVGLWGGLILSTALMFDVAARAATPDSVLIFFATLALLVYVVGTFRPDDASDPKPVGARLKKAGHFFPASWRMVALMYGMMGLAVLAKGPVGLVLPTAVIGMFLLIVRLPPSAGDASVGGRGGSRWRWITAILRPFAPLHFLRTCWFMRPVTALGIALAVALPWYVWVGLRTDGAWLRGFFLTHNVHRAMQPMEGHNGPIFYYLVALLAGFFPWSVFAAPVAIDAGRRIRRQDPWKVGLIFTACWMGVYLGLFSLARTKLPNYITPAYPAVALLTACFIYHFSRGSALVGKIWPRLALGSLALVGVGMLVGLPLAARQFLPGDEWLAVVGLIPLAGAILCFLLLRRGRQRGVAITFAVTALVFCTTLLGLVPVRVSRHQTIGVLLGTIAERSTRPQIASVGCHEPSWVFYAGRPIRSLEAARPSEIRAFLADNRDAFLITTEERYEALEPDLPGNTAVLARSKYFLKDETLVVVGSGGGTTQLATRPGARPATRR